MSGREAVELIRGEKVRYDLVFIDHMMHEMDGIEAARIIRTEIGTEYARNIPIIALTANAIAGSREMFLSSGFNDFISKPIDIKQLDMALNTWVRDKQSKETLEDAERAALEQAEIPEQARPGGEKTGAGDRWLFDHPVAGIDYNEAVNLYGNGAAFMPVLESFAAHTLSLLLEIESSLEDSLSAYAVKVHGLKGACSAICAGEAAALALELETAAKEGNLDFVRSRHKNLDRAVRLLLERLKALLEEGEARLMAGEKEQRPEPDGELLSRLSAAAAGFDSGTVEEVLGELEQYRYERAGELITWLREQAKNFDYDLMRKRLEEILERPR
jgi:CheY-like chemotaxis protein